MITIKSKKNYSMPTISCLIIFFSSFFCHIVRAETEVATCSPTGEECRISSLLTEVEKACSELKSFQAEMKYDIFQPLVDSQRIRTGKLYYQVKDNIVFARIHFDDLVEIDLMEEDENPNPVKFDEDYYFDGLWVHRSNTQTKTVESWEVARERQARQAFRLGQGPFPLPFAITKNDVQEFFTVEIVKSEGKVSSLLKDAFHLKLTPKVETKYAEEYLLIEFWVNSDNYLPIQIRYQEKDYNQTTVLWSKIQAGKNIDDSVFKTPKLPKGWSKTVHPFEEK